MSSTKFADNPDINKLCDKMGVKACSYSVFHGWWGVESKIPNDNDTLELLDGNDPDSFSHDFLSLLQPNRSTRPRKIFWRAEYTRLKDKILHAIEPTARPRANGIVVTGQPGVGKSIFLLAMSFVFLMKKKEFLFLWQSRLYLFVKKDDALAVYVTNPDRLLMIAWERFPYLPALIDLDEYPQEPPYRLASGKLFPIQAAPPEVVRYKRWTKRMIFVPIFYMDIWTRHELCQGLGAQGIIVDNLPGLVDRYGHALRPIMKAIGVPEQAEQDQHAALDQVLNAEGLITTLSQIYNETPETTSELLITIRSHPGPNDGGDLPYYDFVSPYIRLELTSRLRIMKLEQAIHLYQMLEWRSKASRLTAWAFENVVHHILSNSLDTPATTVFHGQHLFHSEADEEASFIATRKTKELFPLVSTNPVYVNFADFSSLQSALSGVFSSSPTNPPLPAVYFIPKNQDNASFNSVLVEGQGCVWIIQTNLGMAREGFGSNIPLLQNLHKAITACGGNPYYRYLYVTSGEKMTATTSSNIPFFPMARSVFYLPLCFDLYNEFTSPSTFELELPVNSQSDASEVESPSW
ncbi:hypothetical protein DL96DRAFT_1713927 [Flagelloscypha sp. PMI_526]|nr:hypothetical protein DL96DRAFT_1713927 [Flagelloscypha sp. PMI_526]